MFCTQCGAQNPDDAKFCFNCGSTLPTVDAAPPPPPPPAMSYVSSAATAVKPVIYAGFWRRALAMTIDQLILSVPSGLLVALFVVPTIAAAVATGDMASAGAIVLSMVAGWVWLGLLLMLVPLAYYSLFECSRFQATPGKIALGIVVTDLEGRRISFLRSLARNLGKIISKIILYIGFIMAGLTDKKQALHDMLADCLVVMR